MTYRSPADVSVVIPTVLRDVNLLDRAVRSVVRQTLRPSEVIVVVDRVDGQLPDWPDSPVPVAVLRTRDGAGPAAARNCGILAASHQYVAFLDDDDYWHERKIEVQMAQVDSVDPARRSMFVGATRGWLLEAGGRRQAPTVLPRPGEGLVDYLFAPSVLRRPSRRVLTPSILVSRSLALAQPFDPRLHHWEDYEWLLRLADHGADIVYCGEPLLTVDARRPHGVGQSAGSSADVDLQWARDFLEPRSERALNNFCLTHVTRSLIDEDRRAEATALGRAILRTGAWNAESMYEHLLLVALPPRLRASLRAARTWARGIRPRPRQETHR